MERDGNGIICFHEEQEIPPVPFRSQNWDGGGIVYSMWEQLRGLEATPSLGGSGSNWGTTAAPTPAGAHRQLGAPRPGPPHPGLTGSWGLPLSDPPCPGLTGSLGLTSPLQLWQKNRCCGTAAAAASAIFPHRRRCRHSSQGSERCPERPRASGELVCSTPGPESAGERDRAVPRGEERPARPLV